MIQYVKNTFILISYGLYFSRFNCIYKALALYVKLACNAVIWLNSSDNKVLKFSIQIFIILSESTARGPEILICTWVFTINGLSKGKLLCKNSSKTRPLIA